MAFAQFNQPLSVTRDLGGSYVNGIWTPAEVVWNDGGSWDDNLSWGDPFPFTVYGSVQPSNENELNLLPEGRREDGAYTIRTRVELRAGDLVPIGDQDHEVIRRQVWQNGVIPHYVGIAVRVQP